MVTKHSKPNNPGKQKKTPKAPSLKPGNEVRLKRWNDASRKEQKRIDSVNLEKKRARARKGRPVG